MSESGDRAKRLLTELPLSKRQRELYQRSADSMEPAELDRVADTLETVLGDAPAAAASLREWLKRRREHTRKKAVVVIKDESYREQLVAMLKEQLEVQLFQTAKEALDNISDSSADVLICDLDLPVMGGLELVRRIRRSTLHDFVVFIRTGNAEEFGRVAAHHAAPYPIDGTAANLYRAIVSAVADV